MNDRKKLIAGGMMLLLGVALIAWNLLRDPYRGLREPPRQKQQVTIDQIPPVVKVVVMKQSAGAVLRKVERKTRMGKTFYKVKFIKNGRRDTLELAEDGSLLQHKAKAVKVAKGS